MRKALPFAVLLLAAITVFVWQTQRAPVNTTTSTTAAAVAATATATATPRPAATTVVAQSAPPQVTKIDRVNPALHVSFGPALEQLLAAAKVSLGLTDQQVDELETLARRHHDSVYRAYASAAKVEVLDQDGVVMTVQLGAQQADRLRTAFFDAAASVAGRPLSAPERSALRAPTDGYFDDFAANERVFAFTGNGAPLAQASTINFEQGGETTQSFGRPGYRAGGTIRKEEFVSKFGPLAERALSSVSTAP